MEQQVTRAREEAQARHNEEIERIRAEARAEMKQMRRQFKQARGVGSQGASPSEKDDPGKTTQDAEMTGVKDGGRELV